MTSAQTNNTVRALRQENQAIRDALAQERQLREQQQKVIEDLRTQLQAFLAAQNPPNT
ncbi:hypothetical protein DFA_06841 [Cavenderia fasciculata]|uniref:DUF3972 domain-containing protein n=1 Tax=Cavenderia fasciculata TaxID=261658 RepID=F4Q2F4_CACFS|nr:uncharacterized protein DFA_06841 [Cavenderia fasciculata]EGG18174.1 hypothetical protein DFA_06841 [Cavenderia fasciculata]|eukprot:XP_004366215.1 hypothetical protein DFA_06841 [Cavenderia fasciculata]